MCAQHGHNLTGGRVRVDSAKHIAKSSRSTGRVGVIDDEESEGSWRQTSDLIEKKGKMIILWKLEEINKLYRTSNKI